MKRIELTLDDAPAGSAACNVAIAPAQTHAAHVGTSAQPSMMPCGQIKRRLSVMIRSRSPRF
jgi:hypothetical protein